MLGYKYGKTLPLLALCYVIEQLVGLAAKQQMTQNPANSISGVKRFMGCIVNDTSLEKSGSVKVNSQPALKV